MVMPMCSDGVHDMFEASAWDPAAMEADCRAKYGLSPRAHWIIEQYGGKDIHAHSNIIFR